MLKNLVLGSEGFVGRPFCSYLENIGETVIHFDVKRGEKEDGRFIKLDLREIDRVYFLAWDVGGAKYLYRRDVQFVQLDWNLKLLINIMPQLQESGRPFLFVSSQLAEEYNTVYGATKRLGEIWTRLIEGVRVRLWNVYGHIEETSKRSHVISDFVKQAVVNGKIRMLTTGEEMRQFIHIDDVCRAFHVGLSNNLPGNYDVTSFEWVRIIDVAQTIAEMTGAEIVPGDRIGSTPVTPMIGKMPDWQPQVTLQEGLQRMVDTLKRTVGE